MSLAPILYIGFSRLDACTGRPATRPAQGGDDRAPVDSGSPVRGQSQSRCVRRRSNVAACDSGERTRPRTRTRPAGLVAVQAADRREAPPCRQRVPRAGGRPDDIIGTMLYLATDASSYTTGALISVDGGYRAAAAP
jgi:hypothetical protein